MELLSPPGHAERMISCSKIAEMMTGEGKTLVSTLNGLYTDLNLKTNEPFNVTLNVEAFVESPNHLM